MKANALQKTKGLSKRQQRYNPRGGSEGLEGHWHYVQVYSSKGRKEKGKAGSASFTRCKENEEGRQDHLGHFQGGEERLLNFQLYGDGEGVRGVGPC